MKTTAAVLLACVFMLAGWLMLAALLYGVLYVASQARQGVGMMHLLNALLIWVLAPGFGGFLATFVTPTVFKAVDPSTIATSFVSVVVTLGVVVGWLLLVRADDNGGELGQFMLFLAQVAAIVVGARTGGRAYVARNS